MNQVEDSRYSPRWRAWLSILRHVDGGKLRRKLTIAILLSGLLAAIDVLAVFLLVPVAKFLTAQSDHNGTGSLSVEFGLFPTMTASQLAILAMCLMLGKTAASALVRWRIIHSTQAAAEASASKIFRGQLHYPAEVFDIRNSAEMLRTVTTTNEHFFNYAFLGLAAVLSDGLALTILLVALVVAVPGPGLISICIFLVAALLYIAVLQKHLVRYTKETQTYSATTIRELAHGYAGWRESRVRGTTNYLLDRFDKERHQLTRALTKYYFLADAPRFFLEAVFLVTVAAVVGFESVVSGSDAVLETAVLFFGVGFRALPALSRVLSGFSLMRTGAVTLELMMQDVVDSPVNDRSEVSETAASSVSNKEETLGPIGLEFCEVSYTYPRAEVPSLDDVSFEIPKGSFCAVVGSSGAGKSTLVDLICGIRHPTSGQIVTHDESETGGSTSITKRVALVPQDICTLDDSIVENVCFGLEFKKSKFDEAISNAQLREFIDSLPNGIHTNVGENGSGLSGGQRQRLGIARALYSGASLIVLDEPTSALDSSTEASILGVLDALRRHVTLLVVTHRPAALNHCDLVIGLEAGRVAVIGSAEEMMDALPHLFEKV